MLVGSRTLQPAGAGEEGAMARAAPGTSRGARAPGSLREALLLPAKLAHVRKLRFRDSPVPEQGSEVFLFTGLMTFPDLMQLLEDSEKP